MYPAFPTSLRVADSTGFATAFLKKHSLATFFFIICNSRLLHCLGGGAARRVGTSQYPLFSLIQLLIWALSIIPAQLNTLRFYNEIYLLQMFSLKGLFR